MVTMLSKKYTSKLPKAILENTEYLHSNVLFSIIEQDAVGTPKEQNEISVKTRINSLTKQSSSRTIIVHALHEHVPLILHHVTQHPNDINALILEGSILSDEYSLLSLDNFPAHIPIIMFHDPKDRIAPINDAFALYTHLKSKNENIYLILVPDENESSWSGKLVAVFGGIFESHNLPDLRIWGGNVSKETIKKFQFEPNSSDINRLTSILEKEKEKEKKIYQFAMVKKILLGGLCLIVLYKMITFLIK
jgi:hypothetical protein